ncbi:MAG: aminotransferase class III-fold pyridoxal phosphate-dependent enzyme, partial [Ginsengibacter sp.]
APLFFVSLVMDIIKFIQFPAAVAKVSKLYGYGSINYKVSLADETNYLVKIYDAGQKKFVQEIERIISVLKANDGLQLHAPVTLPLTKGIPEDVYIRISSFIEGVALNKLLATDAVLAGISNAAAELLNGLQFIESDIVKANEHDWNLRDALRNKDKIQYITDAAERKAVLHYFFLFEYDVLPKFMFMRQSVIHGDLNEANIIIKDNIVQGFIDFGDISYAPVVCELAILLTYIMMMFPEKCFEKAKIIIEIFQKKFPLAEEEIEILPNLIAARLCVSVCNSAEAKSRQNDTDYILISEKPPWHLLNKWVATNPVFIISLFKEYAGYSVSTPDTLSLLERRKKVASASLSLSYQTPIHMSAALFQYMYDAAGGSYLDAYNNIPHVGHSHPAIAEAAARQIRKLNTNTRYLYDSYADYSEKLLSLFPQSLNKVMLVNSGSEASDLATRIARTITGKAAVAVLQWSYHGNTQNGINISSYKFDRKGGAGPNDTILRLPLPKAYKGRFANAEEYFTEAKTLIENFENKNNALAAFIAEPISGCGGQVPLMDGYLSLLVPYLRAKGILIIIDEVQTGFGRLGQWFWGFEMYGIVPDMVVLGKSIANGHPMGAVVTTEAITDAFNNGMEFFSSFGGNPVSCEIGKAVIETIQQEGLQKNALEVGNYWMDELNRLKKEFPHIGDVRGAGLFIGVECIDDHGKENTILAQRIKNELKEAYILSSTDGPLDNVLKMKPPLCFNKENAARFIGELAVLLKRI